MLNESRTIGQGKDAQVQRPNQSTEALASSVITQEVALFVFKEVAHSKREHDSHLTRTFKIHNEVLHTVNAKIMPHNLH